SGDVRLEATERMLDAVIERPEQSTEEVLARHRQRPDDSQELEDHLERIRTTAAEMEGRSLETLERWGMGELMRHFLGRLDPVVVRKSLMIVLEEVSGGMNE
ncbi:MAG: hypothetical protein KAJ42_14085, partial [Gemmatimonadetes bacterium]|nr:hypothetical protein [Gemmatimonadota bacterium]